MTKKPTSVLLGLFMTVVLLVNAFACQTPPATITPSEISASAPSVITPVPLTSPIPVTTTNGTLAVYFIDVGQGDSILIDYGKTEILIDGGEKNTGVADYIRPYVDGALEAMVATHPHADHIGGLLEVLQKYDVKDIWLNGDTYTTKTYTDFMALVNAENATVHEAERGQTMQVGVISFHILNPAKPLGTDTNDNSIVLSLSYGDTDFLFMGDAQSTAESSMLNLVSDIDILKVGHHGSRTSSSPIFLNKVKPEIAIYSAGIGNSYGHPHQETISALTQVGAKIYGTDVNGTIVVTSDGQSFSVTPSRIPGERAPPVVVPPSTTQPVIEPPSITPPVTVPPSVTQPSVTQPVVTPPAIVPTVVAPQAPSLEIVSVTSPIGQGYTATLQARTMPGADCSIVVYYKSGKSAASGLGPQKADSQGNVSWSWKVGTTTTPGSWRILVTATSGGQTVSQETYFTVR